jgi:hypothetical protein
MNPILPLVLSAFVLTSDAVAADQANQPISNPATNLPPKILSFFADKEQQAKRLALRLKVEIPGGVTEYFDAAKKGDWAQAFDLFRETRELLGHSAEDKNQDIFDATAAAVMLEVQLALEQLIEGEPKYAMAYGEGIVRSLPRGSIYFGGTDPGPGLVTALCASHEKGDPFYTLTQNALADQRYLTYLRTMYGDRIKMPAKEDSDRAFKEYLADAERRLQHDQDFPNEPRQVKPGEQISSRNGKISVSGQIAVMSINALIAKSIFDQNPSRDFFIQMSFPLEWMYPHLSPHGLILKLNRKPVEHIPPDIVEKDRKFWLEEQGKMIGGWLKPETSVRAVCAFADKIFGQRDLSGFTGDSKFVQSDQATQMYGKLRSSIGGLYAWRAQQSKTPEEKKRMEQEADFAFRQSFALCPSGSVGVFRYVNLLVEQKRFDDALLIAETAAKLNPAEDQFGKLIEEIRRMKKQ